jgi:hypothetical protein
MERGLGLKGKRSGVSGKIAFSFLPLDSKQRREGLGAAGPTGVGDCRRSRARQRLGGGAK